MRLWSTEPANEVAPRLPSILGEDGMRLDEKTPSALSNKPPLETPQGTVWAPSTQKKKKKF